MDELVEKFVDSLYGYVYGKMRHVDDLSNIRIGKRKELTELLRDHEELHSALIKLFEAKAEQDYYEKQLSHFSAGYSSELSRIERQLVAAQNYVNTINEYAVKFSDITGASVDEWISDYEKYMV